MDVCTKWDGRPESCGELTLNTDEEMNQCVQTPKVNEVTEGQCESGLLNS